VVDLSLYNDDAGSNALFQSFVDDDVLARLKALDARAQRKGLQSLDPKRNRLIPIGTEIDGDGRVTKNSYGVFHLSWRAEKAGDWAERVNSELAEIRERIKATHKSKLRFLIWAGMGGSAEDKSAYNAVRLLGHGPRCYVLDSTDPAKLKAILADMQARSSLSLKEALKGTLIVGMAMGMTSYEPVVNLEKLYTLFEKNRLDSRPNFLYMTLSGSLLDKFAGPRGYRRVELQLDGGNTTAGRHSSPLTRGSLYPLGLAGQDLRAWIEGTYLSKEQIHAAWRLAAYLHSRGLAGQDKVTLLLPDDWSGAGLWTKQDFEESLGKSEKVGIKIVIGENPKLANYRAPKDPLQDRVFLVVQRRGAKGTDREKIQSLRRRYPLAVLQVPSDAPLSTYMQFVHYTVFGLGYLRSMNFVTQPSVELYKAITSRVAADAERAGGITMAAAWQRLINPATTLRCRGGVSLHYPHLASRAQGVKGDAAEVYARLLASYLPGREVDTAELTFFGDTRYHEPGRRLRRVLDRAAESVFRSRLKMPVDVYEGPAMNHSYHEMIIGHGKCFSTVLLSEKSESIPAAGYTADYHTAQFLATQLALAERGRPVVAILLKDLSDETQSALGDFFRNVATHLKVLKAGA
jgi:glucose-6-phosphate isomerase